jgi:purine-binding chemotaxis protein CheW
MEDVMTKGQLLVFMLDNQNYALPVHSVDCVVHAVALTVLPGMAENMLGVMSIHGDVIPVYSARKCMNLPERDMLLSDQIIVACRRDQKVALLVDAITGMTDELVTDQGLVREGDGLVILFDLLGKLPESNHVKD